MEATGFKTKIAEKDEFSEWGKKTKSQNLYKRESKKKLEELDNITITTTTNNKNNRKDDKFIKGLLYTRKYPKLFNKNIT